LILPTHRVVANLRDFDPDTFISKVGASFHHRSFALSDQPSRTGVYEEFRRDLAAGRANRAIGMYSRGAFHLLQPRSDADLGSLLPDLSAAQRKLDVVLLHRLLLEKGLGITPAAVSTERNITYEREMDAAIAAVDQGQAQVCFLLNPVGVEQVTTMALAGEVLPQKSTDFYPKLLSGLTLYRVE